MERWTELRSHAYEIYLDETIITLHLRGIFQSCYFCQSSPHPLTPYSNCRVQKIDEDSIRGFVFLNVFYQRLQ